MSPDAVKATYRRMLNERGETVQVRRYTGAGPNRPRFDADVMAVITGYAAQDFVGSVVVGDRKAIILVEDLIEAQWPVAPGTNRLIVETDFLIVKGKELTIKASDDATRRIAGILIAYELQIKG